MIHVTIEGGHDTIAPPNMTLVLTKVGCISSLRRGKRWSRRTIQTEREGEGALAADEKRGRRA